MKLTISIMTIVTRHFVKASKILECFESFPNSCRGINKLFSLFLTWLFVPQSSTSSAILNRKETTRMKFEHPGWNVSFAKGCGCAPPRTLPDLVKKRWGNGQLKAIFGFHAVLTAFCASFDSEELFVLKLEPSKMNPRCARCTKTVYPMEKLNCLDKV